MGKKPVSPLKRTPSLRSYKKYLTRFFAKKNKSAQAQVVIRQDTDIDRNFMLQKNAILNALLDMEQNQGKAGKIELMQADNFNITLEIMGTVIDLGKKSKSVELSQSGVAFLERARDIENNGEYPLVQREMRLARKIVEMQETIKKIDKDDTKATNEKIKDVLQLVENFKNKELKEHLKTLKKDIADDVVYASVQKFKGELITSFCVEVLSTSMASRLESLEEQLNAMRQNSHQGTVVLESNILSYQQKIQDITHGLRACMTYLSPNEQAIISKKITTAQNVAQDLNQQLSTSSATLKARSLLSELDSRVETLKHLNNNSEETFKAQSRSRELCVIGITKVKGIITELQQVKKSLDTHEAKSIDSGIKEATTITAAVTQKLNDAAKSLGFKKEQTSAKPKEESIRPKRLSSSKKPKHGPNFL